MTKKRKTKPQRVFARTVPVDAMLREAIALHQRGLLPEAQARYAEILKSAPRHFHALHLSGAIALQTNDNEKAIALINQALAVDAGVSMAHGNLGLALARTGQLDAAMASYDRAIAFDPDNADAYINRGDLLMRLQRFETALASYDRAVALRPLHPESWNNRGVALLELGRLEDARQSCELAIEQRPDFAEGQCNWANALKRLGQYEAALKGYDRAVALKPDYADAYNNRANTCSELGRHLEAIADYDRALALRPDHAEARFSRSNALLILGRFEAGWPEYEWRWHERIRVDHSRDYLAPRWHGDTPIAGKTLLLYDEQGLGDTIQFGRYARLACELGANVVLEIQAPLAGLMRSLSGVSQVIARGDALPHFDCHCPLLSLPLAFKTTLESIPSAPYLACDPAKLEVFQVLLGPKRVPRIGLAWSGSAGHANDRNRSIPLAEFLRCLPEHRQYVCLQKEVRESDAAVLAARPDILRVDGQLNDFGDTAALCDLMDLVISVDTSLAHLAGALGKDVRILLPFNPDWRWLLDRPDSPWYPSATLYRQPAIGQWAEPLDRLKCEIG